MELDVRGTPAEQIRTYLIGLGGHDQPDGTVAGPGWTAALTEGEHQAFGIAVPRVVVRFNGQPQAVAAVYASLRIRALRAGG